MKETQPIESLVTQHTFLIVLSYKTKTSPPYYSRHPGDVRLSGQVASVVGKQLSCTQLSTSR